MGYPGLKAEKPNNSLLHFFIAMTTFFALTSIYMLFNFVIPVRERVNKVKNFSKINAVAVTDNNENTVNKKFSDIDIQKLVAGRKNFRINIKGNWYFGGKIMGFVFVDNVRLTILESNYEVDNFIAKDKKYLPLFHSYFDCRINNINIGDYLCIKGSGWAASPDGLYFSAKGIPWGNQDGCIFIIHHKSADNGSN